jgi:TM2 domain-containing membrane protein YozV
VTCPACNAVARDGTKFCAACGTPLAAACPACGAPVEAGKRFCGRCGTALGAAPPASAGPPGDGGAAPPTMVPPTGTPPPVTPPAPAPPAMMPSAVTPPAMAAPAAPALTGTRSSPPPPPTLSAGPIGVRSSPAGHPPPYTPPPAYGGPPSREPVFAEGKDPMTAAILSALVVGLGQFYNGDVKKGAALFLGAVVGGMVTFFIAWLIIAPLAAYDAYKVATRDRPLWNP